MCNNIILKDYNKMEYYSVLILALRVLGLRLFSQHDVATKKLPSNNSSAEFLCK